MSEGWIKLHRQLMDHDLWTQEPFTRGQAWVDLLMLANHAPAQFRVRGNLVLVNRGEVARSEDSLAQRWKWSRNKVRRFMVELSEKTIQQIEQQKSPILSKIRIINYDLYQSNDPSDTTDDTTERQQKDTNKNDKNENNVKKDKREVFSIPEKQEVDLYFVEIGSTFEESVAFMDHYESVGWFVGKKKMVSWKATARTWVRRSGVFSKPTKKIQKTEEELRADAVLNLSKTWRTNV